VAALRASTAPGLFAGFDPARFPQTSLPALASVAAAYRVSASTGELFSVAVRDALFERGEDIADPDVLERLRGALDVPAPNACDEQRIASDTAKGTARGARGSPHYFLGEGSDFFCPLLDISHRGDQLEIRENAARFAEFIAAALGP